MHLNRLGARVAGAVLVVAVLAGFGCGGGGESGGASFEKGGPPAPKACLKRWNGDQTAISAGLHSYTSHLARAGQVRLLTDRKNGLVNRCLVVFAVRESDSEYGIVGEVELPSGWNDLRYLPVDSVDERVELQRRAAGQANSKLTDDGRLSPL